MEYPVVIRDRYTSEYPGLRKLFQEVLMPSFSTHSMAVLNTCDDRLVRVFTSVVLSTDCRVIQGARPKQEEEVAIAAGRSHLKDALNSMHVIGPERPKSRAVDVVPYPVVWPDRSSLQYVHQVGRFYFLAGIVKTVADELGIKLRWGGDWDQDQDFTDQTFDDLDHWELVEP